MSSAIRCPACCRLLGNRVRGAVELRARGELVARFRRGVLGRPRCRERLEVSISGEDAASTTIGPVLSAAPD